MSENNTALLPEGTVLTTEGKDKILTGKLQRNVVDALVEMAAYKSSAEQTVAVLVKELRDVAPQNVYRTLKVLEEKGIIRVAKHSSGGKVIYHGIGRRDSGAKGADGYAIWEYYIASKATRHMSESDAILAVEVVGNIDYVAAICDSFEKGDVGPVFTSARPATEGGRWRFTTFNKQSLFKLAARQYFARINDSYGAIPCQLAEQAARGAWQPFFDTLKKNKVIAYHPLKTGERVMVWDTNRWFDYSTRVMKERQAIIDSWEV
ncbi:helix-turn-helix domain-containing protein [Aeromonas rivipollensis]|uniref:helix-turn-helix domain-containing protein n=1 Tax=Aeromonas rivipollensis TaxID=948519 RepID=UPI0038D104E2